MVIERELSEKERAKEYTENDRKQEKEGRRYTIRKLNYKENKIFFWL